jgi:hypothetical protein
MILWYHGRSMVVPWYCQCHTGCQAPFSVLRLLIEATQNARQETECKMHKPPLCDINATSKPPQCVLIARR